MHPGDHDTWMCRLSLALTRAAPTTSLGRRLSHAVALATDADGAGLTLLCDAIPHVITSATDTVSDQLLDVDHVLGDGPITHAARTGQPERLGLCPATDNPWPAFSAAARQRVGDLNSIVVIPVAFAGHTFSGAMIAYRRGGDLDVGKSNVVEDLGDAVAATAENLTGGHSAALVLVNESWPRVAMVSQAMGMVMVDQGTDQAGAYSLIRARAFATCTPLDDVCTVIAQQRINLDEL